MKVNNVLLLDGNEISVQKDWWGFSKIILFFLCWVLILKLPDIIYPPNFPEIGEQAILGKGIKDGEILYQDLWDFKPPNTYFLVALVFKILPQNFTSLQWLSFVNVFTTTLAFYLLAKIFYNKIILTASSERVSILTTLLFSFFIINPAFATGGTDPHNFVILPNILMMISFLLFLLKNRNSLSPGSAILLFLTGFFASLSMFFKIQGVFDLGAPLFYLLVIYLTKKIKLPIFLSYLFFILIGFLIPFIALSLYFSSHGAFTNFVESVFGYGLLYMRGAFNISQYAFGFMRAYKGYFSNGALLLFLSFTAFFQYFFNRELIKEDLKKIGKQIVFLIAPLWFIFSFWSINIGKFAYTYFLQLIPSLALSSGYFINNFLNLPKGKKKNHLPIMLSALLIFFYLSSYNYQFNILRMIKFKVFPEYRKSTAQEKIASFISAKTPSSAGIYMWGGNFDVIFLANRKALLKLPPLTLLANPHYISKEKVENLIAYIANQQPELIIDMANNANQFPEVYIDLSLATGNDIFNPFRKYIKENYLLSTTIDGWDIYQIKQGASLN